MNIPLISVTPLLAALLFSCSAADWPQWRGPHRDGICTETGLLQSWPAGGPPLTWTARGIGSGYTTVSVVGGRLFTMGEKDGSSYVHALQAQDGKIVWSTKVGKAGAPGWGGFAGPRSTPTLDGDRLFALGQYGELVCLESSSGKEIWRKDFSKDFGGKLPEWGFSESPLVDGDRVIVTPGGPQGTLVALNKQTGDLLWQTKDFKDSAHYSSVIIASIGNVRQYIQLTDASVAGVDATGKVLWIAPRKGATAVIPTPIYDRDHVYVTSGYGVGCNLFRITKDGDAFKAEQVYANKLMVNHHGGVIRVGDNVYGFSEGKGWVCQNMLTGASVWEEKSKLGKGSLLLADGRFILRAEAGPGTVALIEASPAGYKELGRFDQPERSEKNSWAHPVVANGKLYLRDQDVLLCYNLKAQ